MTQPTPAEYHTPLLALDANEVRALTRAALFWYAGEGAMDGELYEALHTALVKLHPTPAEVKP